jgi:hypothetical protein
MARAQRPEKVSPQGPAPALPATHSTSTSLTQYPTPNGTSKPASASPRLNFTSVGLPLPLHAPPQLSAPAGSHPVASAALHMFHRHRPLPRWHRRGCRRLLRHQSTRNIHSLAHHNHARTSLMRETPRSPASTIIPAAGTWPRSAKSHRPSFRRRRPRRARRRRTTSRGGKGQQQRGRGPVASVP